MNIRYVNSIIIHKRFSHNLTNTIIISNTIYFDNLQFIRIFIQDQTRCPEVDDPPETAMSGTL